MGMKGAFLIVAAVCIGGLAAVPQQYSSVGNPGCICPAIFQPVCGVDGKTYSNACSAKCAGVAVASNGSCVSTTTGKSCLCTLEFHAVCGTDGKNYSNPCVAKCAGTTVAHDGNC